MQKKDTYTREEVIEMLKEMQKETAHTNGFFCRTCYSVMGDQNHAW